MSLKAFFAENAEKIEPQELVISKRFIGEDGQPECWRVGPVSGEEDEKLRASCTYKVQVPGKRGQFMQETDFNAYLGRLAARCVKYPDLYDAGLQDSYQVKGAENLLKTMLTSGEYARLLEAVQKICGFDETMEEKVEQAKN